MTIKTFSKLEQIERQRQDALFAYRVNRITDREFEHKTQELNREQSELRHEAAKELKAVKNRLAKNHQTIQRAAIVAAEANARNTDYARLNAAHETAQRLLKRAGNPEAVENLMREATAGGDKHLQRALFDEFIQDTEGHAPNGADGMRLLELKNRLVPELERLEFSDQQREVKALREQLDQEIVNFTQEVAKARETFKPAPVKYVDGSEQPEDVYKGLADDVRLVPHDQDPMTVEVELGPGWESPVGAEAESEEVPFEWVSTFRDHK